MTKKYDIEKVSPRPWSAQAINKSMSWVFIYNSDDLPISSASHEDGAHIVHCVNNFDAVVKALTVCLPMARPRLHYDSIREYEQLITKAKGGLNTDDKIPNAQD